MHPLPQGNDLSAIWSNSDNDVWVGDLYGNVMHFDGRSWQLYRLREHSQIKALWGTGPRDIWALTDDRRNKPLLHFDGKFWSSHGPITHGALHSLWAMGPNDIWAVGSLGQALHFDGNHWNSLPAPTTLFLTAVAGFGPSEVWAPGFSDDFVHTPGRWFVFDGHQWTAKQRIDAGDVILDAATVSSDEIWAVGSRFVDESTNHALIVARSRHSDGWVPIAASDPVLARHGILNDLCADGHGGAWILPLDPVTPSETNRSQVLHVDAHHQVASYGLPPGTRLWTMDRGHAKEKWAVGENGAIVHGTSPPSWSDYRWTASPSLQNWIGATAIWGSSPKDIWIAGYGHELLHYDGQSLSPVQLDDDLHLMDIHGSSARDVWAVGWSGTALHYDGSQWRRIDSLSGEDLYAVWSFGPSDALAVGCQSSSSGGYVGSIARFDGSSWTRLPKPENTSGTECWYAVWARSQTDVWVVGGQEDESVLVHFDGQTWKKSQVFPLENASRVWGTDQELWVIGNEGMLWHLAKDGHWYNQKGAAGERDLYSIRGNGRDVWIVGDFGLSWKWNGSSWKKISTGTYYELRSVWVSGQGEAWIGGENWSVLRRLPR